MPPDRCGPIGADVAREPSERMSVVIVYEDLLTGLLARGMFDQVAAALRRDYEIHATVGRLDVLADLARSDQADSDDQSADVVVVSVYGRETWPPGVDKCLGWSGARTGRQSGLAGIVVRTPAPAPQASECGAALEQLARRRGWDFHHIEAEAVAPAI
jgi:hypothetical protein